MNLIVRRAVSRMKSCAVGSNVTLVARSSKERANREARETAMIAAMKIAAILTPSGRSMMLAIVV